MKSKILSIIVISALAIVSIINVVYYINSSFFYDLTDLPTGNFLYSAMSPDGEKTLSIYRVDVEKIGYGIRGEIVSQNGAKNVYWETNTAVAIATWLDDNTILVNDRTVDINGEAFDSRRNIELPEGSIKNYTQVK